MKEHEYPDEDVWMALLTAQGLDLDETHIIRRIRKAVNMSSSMLIGNERTQQIVDLIKQVGGAPRIIDRLNYQIETGEQAIQEV